MPFTVPASSGQSPYPGPPESGKEPDPENTEETLLFQCFLSSYFPHPLPLAPLFIKKLKKVVRKGGQLYRLLRLNLGTSKTSWRVTFWDENWPVLWHIVVFSNPRKTRKSIKKAIRKLQRIFRRRA